MDAVKLLPRNLDAEEAVLASLLVDGSLVEHLALERADFYYEQNQQLYGACLALKGRGVSVNQITVAQELARCSNLEAVGGASYLSHLISICSTPYDIGFYAEIVHNLSVSRQLISAASQIAAWGYDMTPDSAGTIEKADTLLLNLRKKCAQTFVITPEDRIKSLNERYETLMKSESGNALPTGLQDLDDRIGGGFYPGDLVIVGARPGMGKTTFLEWVSHQVVESKQVLFCSGEMDVNSMSDREIAGNLGVPVNRIRCGSYDIDLYPKIIGQGLEEIRRKRLYFFEASRSNPFNTTNIYQAALQTQLRYGLDMIVVDYLGLLSDRFGTNQNERLGYITRALKEMARDMRVPMLVAHQLNRGLEARDEKRPQLHDLRDSGNIEQDADVVLLLYRDSYYNKKQTGVTEIIVAKQRQGESNKKARVYFDNVHRVYRALAEDEERG